MDDEHATACAIDPSNKFVCVATQFTRSIRIYELNSAKPVLVKTFPTQHKTVITKLGWCRERMIFSFGTGNDTTMYFHNSIDGKVISSVNTHQMQNFAVSLVSTPSQTMLSVGAFTSDAKIWEVAFDKVGLFAGVNKIMDLKGHRSGIVSVSIGNDTKMAVSASNDKTIRLWNLDVRFRLNEDAKLIATFELDTVPQLVVLVMKTMYWQ